MQFLILGAKGYNFTNSAGEKVQGITVYYADVEPGPEGILPIKANLPHDKASKLKALPGVYKVDFSFVPDSRGKPVLRWRDVEFVADAVVG